MYTRIFDIGCDIQEKSQTLFTVYLAVLGVFVPLPKQYPLVHTVGKYGDRNTAECASPVTGEIMLIPCRSKFTAYTIGRVIARGRQVWLCDL